jgi:hypothetical protein
MLDSVFSQGRSRSAICHETGVSNGTAQRASPGCLSNIMKQASKMLRQPADSALGDLAGSLKGVFG